jgi:y4mF family transcriptional regulator
MAGVTAAVNAGVQLSVLARCSSSQLEPTRRPVVLIPARSFRESPIQSGWAAIEFVKSINRNVRAEGGGVIKTSFSDYLAAEVRARRAALRLTQHDLAQLAGVSERFVRFVEQGKPSVQLDSLLSLLGTLGLELQLATRTRTPTLQDRMTAAGQREQT